MENRLNRIEDKVDALKDQFEAQKAAADARAETLNRAAQMIMQINTKMGDQSQILASNTSDLKYHILRTDLAEQSIALLRQEIAPLKQAHVEAQGAKKAIKVIWGVVVFASGFALGVAKIFFGD